MGLRDGQNQNPELRLLCLAGAQGGSGQSSCSMGSMLAEGLKQAVAVEWRELSWLAQALSACP